MHNVKLAVLLAVAVLVWALSGVARADPPKASADAAEAFTPFALFWWAPPGVATGDGAGSPKTEPPKASGDSAEDITAWCERRMLAPFRVYAQMKGDPTSAADAWDEPTNGPKADATFTAKTRELRKSVLDAMPHTAVIIATVPDPIDSGYVYQFEQIWRAVTLGVERNGFLRDAAWLPWADDHLASAKNRVWVEACRTRVPGVRLLRRDAAPPTSGRPINTIAVLYVGETPVEGVHKAALERALKLANELDTGHDKGHEILRIVGPTYSGSAESIRQVLDATTALGEVTIISGSATTPQIRDTFAAVRGHKTTFALTTIDDESSEQLFFRWLKEREGPEGDRLQWALSRNGSRLGRVGMLVESGTLFGARDSPTSKSFRARYRPEVVLRFPRGVGELERAHAAQEARQRAEQKAGSPDLPQGPGVLAPAFDERETPREAASGTSPKNVTAMDLELRNLLAEVSRQGLAYLLIRATDSGDAVFLARQVRDVAPDVRLVFMSSDILFLHPGFASALRGSLMVSAYPFFGTSDLASESADARHTHWPWESDTAEGTFNATVAMIGETVPSFDPRTTLERLAEYRPLPNKDSDNSNCESKEPILPLWITTIGNDAIFPVDVVPQDPPGPTLFNPCHAVPQSGPSALPPGGKWDLRVDEDITPPRGWQFVLFAVLLVTFVEWMLGWRRDRAFWGGEAPRSNANPTRWQLFCWRLGGGATGGAGRSWFGAHPKNYDGRPDLILSRAKYLRYSAVRGAVVVTTLAYMTIVHWLALAAEPNRSFHVWSVVLGWCVLIPTIVFILYAVVRLAAAVSADLNAIQEVSKDAYGIRDALRGSRRTLKDNGIRVALKKLARALREPRVSHAVHAFLFYVLFFAFIAFTLFRACADLPGFFAAYLPPRATPRGVAFILRSLPINSGVSAAVVVVLLGAALWLWTSSRLVRGTLTHGLNLITPDDPHAASPLSKTLPIASAAGDPPPMRRPIVVMPIAYVLRSPEADLEQGERDSKDQDIRAQEERLQNVLQRPAMYPASVAVSLLIMVVPIVAFFIKQPTSLEPKWDTIALVSLLCLLTFIVALTAQHLLEFWLAFRRLLDRLRTWRHSSAFRLANPLVGATISKLVTGRHLEANELLLCAELAQQLDLDADKTIRDAAIKLRELRTHDYELDELGDDRRGRTLGQALLTRAKTLAATLTQSRTPLLDTPTEAPRAGAQEAESKALAPKPSEGAPAAAVFVGCVLCILLNRYVRHFRSFMTATTTSAVMLVLVITVYPFEPHRLMMATTWVLILFVVGAGALVFFGMERDPVLSATAGTAPSQIKLTREVLLRFVTWVFIPIASILAAQYPQIGHIVGAIFEPFAVAFR